MSKSASPPNVAGETASADGNYDNDSDDGAFSAFAIGRMASFHDNGWVAAARDSFSCADASVVLDCHQPTGAGIMEDKFYDDSENGLRNNSSSNTSPSGTRDVRRAGNSSTQQPHQSSPISNIQISSAIKVTGSAEKAEPTRSVSRPKLVSKETDSTRASVSTLGDPISLTRASTLGSTTWDDLYLQQNNNTGGQRSADAFNEGEAGDAPNNKKKKRRVVLAAAVILLVAVLVTVGVVVQQTLKRKNSPSESQQQNDITENSDSNLDEEGSDDNDSGPTTENEDDPSIFNVFPSSSENNEPAPSSTLNSPPSQPAAPTSSSENNDILDAPSPSQPMTWTSPASISGNNEPTPSSTSVSWGDVSSGTTTTSSSPTNGLVSSPTYTAPTSTVSLPSEAGAEESSSSITNPTGSAPTTIITAKPSPLPTKPTSVESSTATLPTGLIYVVSTPEPTTGQPTRKPTLFPTPKPTPSPTTRSISTPKVSLHSLASTLYAYLLFPFVHHS